MPNLALKAARQAAGYPSQQALADALSRSARQLGLTIVVSVRQVRRWESDSPPWPQEDYQRLLTTSSASPSRTWDSARPGTRPPARHPPRPQGPPPLRFRRLGPVCVVPCPGPPVAQDLSRPRSALISGQSWWPTAVSTCPSPRRCSTAPSPSTPTSGPPFSVRHPVSLAASSLPPSPSRSCFWQGSSSSTCGSRMPPMRRSYAHCRPRVRPMTACSARPSSRTPPSCRAGRPPPGGPRADAGCPDLRPTGACCCSRGARVARRGRGRVPHPLR